jgi:membrane associated rhomboid family serine protease
MVPISSDSESYQGSFPITNILLIVANISVFIYQILLPDQASTCFTYANSFDPAVLLGKVHVPSAYAAAGCMTSNYHLHPAWETIFTSMFLHDGILHIGGNMLFLYVFGNNVENKLGHLRYLFFYLFCGVMATVTQTTTLVLSQSGGLDVPNLGASGAIAGVLGAYFVFFPAARIHTLIFPGIFVFITAIPAIIFIGLWVLLQIFDGIISLNSAGASANTGVAYFAHIGGFVTGFIIAKIANIVEPQSSSDT